MSLAECWEAQKREEESCLSSSLSSTTTSRARGRAHARAHAPPRPSPATPLPLLPSGGVSGRFGLFSASRVAEVARVASTAPPVFEQARTLGWRVEALPSGILVDTRRRPTDPDLLDRLHGLLLHGDELLDPGEVVLRGELDAIEQEFLP
ncbi:hypothetical protein [Geminicoccus flavidas]|uniref:hypothetical protein n=1 Tax=Geminicoccus flavidas TaxID=2506407 RepID=UPI0013567447|nr:hypothetical protein [Geminicoccus flavidas]